MSLNRLRASIGARKKKKLLGRGPGTGHGKTSTRGHKGQKSRSGRGTYLGFEGGQSPLIRRIPKRGFFHSPKKEYQIVNLESLNIFSKDTVVDPKVLHERGLIKMQQGAVKILGDGKLDKALTVKAHKFSGAAAKKIESLGGKIEIISLTPQKPLPVITGSRQTT